MQGSDAGGVPDYYAANAERHGWGGTRGVTDERASVLRQFVVGRRVLDIGCAGGAYVHHLATLGFDVTGIDFVAGFLRSATERGRRGNFALSDANTLPFRANSFDTTILFDVLEHMPDDRAVLREAARVTAQRLVLIVPRTTEPKLEQQGLIFRHHLDRTHLRTYTEEEAHTLFPGAATRIGVLDRVSLKHAMLSMVQPLPVRSFLRLLLRPCDVSTHSECLVVIDLPNRAAGEARKELAAA